MNRKNKNLNNKTSYFVPTPDYLLPKKKNFFQFENEHNEIMKTWDKMVQYIKEGKNNSTPRDLLEICKIAYRKHNLNDDSVGWEELSDILYNILVNIMGDDNFSNWLQNVTKINHTNICPFCKSKNVSEWPEHDCLYVCVDCKTWWNSDIWKDNI